MDRVFSAVDAAQTALETAEPLLKQAVTLTEQARVALVVAEGVGVLAAAVSVARGWSRPADQLPAFSCLAWPSFDPHRHSRPQ